MTWRTTRIQKKDAYGEVGVFMGFLPFGKTRPGPGGCITARLSNPFYSRLPFPRLA